MKHPRINGLKSNRVTGKLKVSDNHCADSAVRRIGWGANSRLEAGGLYFWINFYFLGLQDNLGYYFVKPQKQLLRFSTLPIVPAIVENSFVDEIQAQ